MASIASSSIQELKASIPIEDVVRAYVELKASGSALKGLSPFTNEKTPSFFVYPDKGYFYCFSSSQGGDVIKFVQHQENMTFVDAVEHLAQRFNFSLRYETTDGSAPAGPGFSEKRLLFEIQEAAADFFHKAFLGKSSEALKVRTYWQEERAFSLEQAKDWKIGYSPSDKNELLKALRKKGYQEKVLAKSGLFFTSDRGGGRELISSCRFRGRLMIPIRDVQGRIAAFTARKTDLTPEDDPASEAKYVNSPETDIFKKGDLLFGLDIARVAVKDSDTFILVEGQLDALRCRAAGFETAVAPQGTGLTDHQVILMRRYASRITTCFDGDSAGLKASIRAFEIGLKHDMEVSFAKIPPGDDPDTIIRRDGEKVFQEILSQPIKGLAGIIQFLTDGKIPQSPEEKRKLTRQLFERFVAIPSSVTLNSYLDATALALGIPPHVVRSDFETMKSGRFQAPGRNREEESSTDNDQAAETPGLTSPEEELLLIVLSYSNLTEPIASVLNCEWISNSSLQSLILRRLIADLQAGEIEPEEVKNKLMSEAEENSDLYRIFSRDIAFEDPKKSVNECLKVIYRKFFRKKKEDLLLQIREAQETNITLQSQLLQEYTELLKHQNHYPSI